MIYRELAEKMHSRKYRAAKMGLFAFYRFNALNNCEKELMTWLKKTSRARFLLGLP